MQDLQQEQRLPTQIPTQITDTDSTGVASVV